MSFCFNIVKNHAKVPAPAEGWQAVDLGKERQPEVNYHGLPKAWSSFNKSYHVIAHHTRDISSAEHFGRGLGGTLAMIFSLGLAWLSADIRDCFEKRANKYYATSEVSCHVPAKIASNIATFTKAQFKEAVKRDGHYAVDGNHSLFVSRIAKARDPELIEYIVKVAKSDTPIAADKAEFVQNWLNEAFMDFRSSQRGKSKTSSEIKSFSQQIQKLIDLGAKLPARALDFTFDELLPKIKADNPLEDDAVKIYKPLLAVLIKQGEKPYAKQRERLKMVLLPEHYQHKKSNLSYNIYKSIKQELALAK